MTNQELKDRIVIIMWLEGRPMFQKEIQDRLPRSYHGDKLISALLQLREERRAYLPAYEWKWRLKK